MSYVRRKASLIEAVLVSQETWRQLTKPQRAALLGQRPVHPRVQSALREKRLMRRDGKPTAWGRTVLRFTTTLRQEEAT